MIQNRENIREQLMERDPSFRQMVEDHRVLDLRSDRMANHHYLTVSEQQELIKIKRKKLLIRDKMERRLNQAAQEVNK